MYLTMRVKPIWQIPADAKCNGTPDCPDASDETHALCHNHYCHPNSFRCAYGGCVGSAAACDGWAECFDNSDERLLRCRNKTGVLDGEFKCENGDKIPVYQLCDGEKNCADGTDESVRACAGRRCGKGQFQCKYGACIPAHTKCDADGHRDCADGSDEDDVLCNRPQTVITNSDVECYLPSWPDHGAFIMTLGPTHAISHRFLSLTFIVECEPPYRLEVPEEIHCERGEWSAPIPECKLPPAGSNLCVLPDYPYVGSYSVSGRPDARPGMMFDEVTVNVTCNAPYSRVGPEELQCYYGHWSAERFSHCWYFCENPRHPSVTYYCGDNYDQECGDLVQSGDSARPKCNDNYHSTRELQSVKCFDNGWFFLQTCEPDIGIPEPNITISKEEDTLDNSTPTVIPNSTPIPDVSTTPKNLCVLPENPEYGTYSVSGRPDARPGMMFDNVTMVVSCESRMRPVGPVEMHCSDGKWSVDKFTSCWYFCEVPRHPSVTYYCGNRYNVKCDDFVISDTSVYPKCNDFYKTTVQMLHMSCIYGNWDFVETCALDYNVSLDGNNMTVRLGEKLVLHLSGSEYSLAVDINSETIINKTVPEPKLELRDFDYTDYWG
ncbi:modular serine protease-like [Cydia pomonella]|uniref:modular serine protease-like n=1 Tax=Cydia pomonella TaxID=82600 RepID=UPI002ADD8962|nr:modular serine protease-like [Cydia pomonella]